MNVKNPRNAGVCNGRARLNDDDVLQIRALWESRAHSQRELAQLFDCSKGTIWFVVHRRQWRHI
ncbi:hypothetical protein [Burkholderia ubonensis]|uniref:hypothetical protein n=1 Tax=Burkholderia ubonensis TaxID=101571 RepID=UPI00075D3908|nr:hypothetical protein [Burkholderia ubonensis]